MLLGFTVTLILGILVAPLTAEAQPGAKIPKVGILNPGTATGGAAPLIEAFKQGMRERGYIEGQRVVFELRSGDFKRERLAEAAAELVRMKVDVILTSTDEAIAAVKQQTQTIPIVMANSTDPVGTGFVVSLARPGRNITGNSSMSPELNGKRLELLKELVPGLSRVAILWNPDIRGAVFDYRETEGAARSLHLQLQSVEVSRADDLDRLLAARLPRHRSVTTGYSTHVEPALGTVGYGQQSCCLLVEADQEGIVKAAFLKLQHLHPGELEAMHGALSELARTGDLLLVDWEGGVLLALTDSAALHGYLALALVQERST